MPTKAKVLVKLYRGPRTGSIKAFSDRELFKSLEVKVTRSGRGRRVLTLPDGMTIDSIKKRSDRYILRELIRRGYRAYTQGLLF